MVNLEIPEGITPGGWEYRWVRKSAFGDIDVENLMYMGRQGYRPVPAERHPELSMEQGGLILCERRAELLEHKEWKKPDKWESFGGVVYSEHYPGG